MAWKVKGSGTAEFRGKSSCRVEFQVQNTAAGEIRRERKTFKVISLTKKEKERCKREFRAELETGVDRERRNITFGEYAEQWMEMRKADPKVAATYANNVTKLNNINLYFKDWKITEITRADVKRFQLALVTPDENGFAKTKSGNPVCGTTANGIRKLLRMILQEAVRDDIIVKNPCDDLPNPARDTKEKTPLTPEQAMLYRKAIDEEGPSPLTVAYRLCLFAGLREGEAVGLRWNDFDEEAGTISVNRSICQETFKFKETKTEAGKRTVPLDAQTIAFLKAWKAIQAPELKKRGKDMGQACIACESFADYMRPQRVCEAMRSFVKRHDLPKVTPHVLRHTYCTLLFAANVDLKTVQYLMGHKDPKTTLRIYTHYLKSNGVKAASAIGALMDSLPTTNIVAVDTVGAAKPKPKEPTVEEVAKPANPDQSGQPTRNRETPTPSITQLRKAV